MLISYTESGGMAYFPGLAKGRTLEVSALPQADQQELRHLVEASQFFTLPESRQPSTTARGAQHYVLTISEGDQQHTLCLAAPLQAGPLQGLLQCVRRHITT